ncbi:MAG: hypothetical protein CM15mP83_2430 [Flavobacteriaceae bacterium]|nr:MAG: hypothetical protein CM15mP83_2430 [Flavobacteriaceae bacterium]
MNKSDETPNPNEFSYQNTAFVIGNGGYDSNGVYDGTPESYSNAFEVLFDGTTTIAGSMTATSFIGDGSQLTNLPSSGADSPFSYNSNEAGVLGLGLHEADKRICCW